MRSRRLALRALFTTSVAAFLGPPLHGQAVAAEVRAGAFVPASNLGTVGVTGARLSPSAAVSVALAFAPTALGPFRLVLTGTTSVGSGTQVRPTSSCLVRCEPYTADYGSFRSGSLDAAVTVPFAGLGIRVALGPALRQYHYPTMVCACDPPQPGETSEWPFFRSHTAAAVHAGLGLVGPAVGRFVWVFQLDGTFSRSRWGSLQRDLVATVGVGL